MVLLELRQTMHQGQQGSVLYWHGSETVDFTMSDNGLRRRKDRRNILQTSSTLVDGSGAT